MCTAQSDSETLWALWCKSVSQKEYLPKEKKKKSMSYRDLHEARWNKLQPWINSAPFRILLFRCCQLWTLQPGLPFDFCLSPTQFWVLPEMGWQERIAIILIVLGLFLWSWQWLWLLSHGHSYYSYRTPWILITIKASSLVRNKKGFLLG